MTFDRRFCEDMFDALGHDDTLRHGYRVYLWRQVLGFVHHSLPHERARAGADLCSAIEASISIVRPVGRGVRTDVAPQVM